MLGLLLALLMHLVLAPIALGGVGPDAGLKVEPGALFIQNIFLGKVYDIYKESGLRLTVHNQSDKVRTYTVSTHLPSDVGAKGWLQGYTELPDLSWFWFDQQGITIKANSVGRAKMYFQIPKEERYYNQHWVLALGIRGKGEGGTTILLGAYPKIQLETESRGTVRARGGEPFGFEPSVISIENPFSSREQQTALRLYNNEGRARRYQLISKTFPSRKGELPSVSPSPGYEWIPDPGWIVPKSGRLSVGPMREVSVPLTITIPGNPGNRGKKWESILFVEAEDGRTRFARIQIQTEK